MGLDWNPANKPAPGHEDEFWKLFEALATEGAEITDAQSARYDEISISAFQTLRAPRVGIDAIATEWATEMHARQKEKTPLEPWLAKLHGLHVVTLADPCDGLSRYTNGQITGYVEPFSFRAEFLKDTLQIIGKPMIESAYVDKTPQELAAYGRVLLESATEFAQEKGIPLDAIDEPENPQSIEFRLDVVRAAAKWCLFWSHHGHPLEAYW